MVRLMNALAAFHQVEMLTYCLMSNHFHVLERVPERPDVFDMPLDGVLEPLERAVGRNSMKLLRSQLKTSRTNGSEEIIEHWRQQEDGTLVHRGVNEKLRKKREAGRGGERGMLLRRVQIFRAARSSEAANS